MISKRMPCNVVAAVSTFLLGIGAADASSVLPLSDTTTAAGTTAFGTNTALAVPGSYTYADSFGGGSGNVASSAANPAGFYDDFVFTITGASADSVTSTINLGNVLAIDGLQVALFNYSGGSVPVSGTPLATGWSTAINGNGIGGTVSVVSPTVLAPGTYALEIQGTVAGSAGGSYAGSLNLAPVPLPPALPLLASAVVGFGVWKRRRA